jgi:exodeoxyribonuclease VII small subunit
MNGVADTPPSLQRISTLVEDGVFEETLSALELVVEHLERGRLTMDESIAWYEAGLGLMRRCSQLLEQAELRISALDAGSSVGAGSGRMMSSDDSWDADAS